MGRGGKGQVRMIKKQMGSSDTNELGLLFNQLLGDEKSLDPLVVMEKHNKLVSNINIIKKILEKFIDTILIPKFQHNKKISDSVLQINEFIEKCNDILSLPIEQSSIINVYKTTKESEVVTKILTTCKNLLFHQKYLDNNNTLSDTFIHNEPGITLELFSFSSLNFKTIFSNEDMKNDNKKYVLIVLSMIYTKSYDIYNLITSPDIDIEKFSNIIIDSIKEAKKSIPRCDKAFKKISQSVDLLKNNFNTYYKDFIESQSPTIIVENFILDLSKDLDADTETTRQFKRIVMFYQKKYNESGQKKDPKLKKMFETIQEKFKILETNDSETSDEEECKE